MVTDVAIAMPDGRVNGYHYGGLDGDGGEPRDAEQLVSSPASEPTSDDETVVSAAAQVTAEATAPCQPTASAADNVKPAPEKAGGQSRPASKAGASKATSTTKVPNPRVEYVPQWALDADLAKLETLSSAALAGDTTALDKLRAALDRCPHIWRRLADLEHLVELKMIALVAGDDPLRSEAFRKRCSELRHTLLDGEPKSLATKMAVSRVVMCWLFAQFLELRALDSPNELRSIKQLEQAERRYQVAMRTYGMARQLDVRLQQLAQQSN